MPKKSNVAKPVTPEDVAKKAKKAATAAAETPGERIRRFQTSLSALEHNIDNLDIIGRKKAIIDAVDNGLIVPRLEVIFRYMKWYATGIQLCKH